MCVPLRRSWDTKELQSVQVERSLRILDSSGVIFEDNDSIQGEKESSVLLRNVVKPEDVDDPISVGGCASLSLLLFVISFQDSH
jgi:nuclear GTP-binding protein